MKKRILLLLTIVAAILSLAGIFTACGAKEDHTVTVLTPESALLKDVTISWLAGGNEKATQKTDESGKATVKLPSAAYTIKLSGSEDEKFKLLGYDNFVQSESGKGYTYTTVSTTQKRLTITLKVVEIDYSVKVVNNDAPVANVSVAWDNENGSSKGTAKTDANGRASCKLSYDNYYVTLSSLPQGTTCDVATATGANPTLALSLTAQGGESDGYSVTVKSEGGLLFKNHVVRLYDENNKLKERKYTNDAGVCVFTVAKGKYTARVGSVPDGYTATEVTLDESATSGTIVMKSAVITSAPAQNKTYVIGDVIHDYTFTTTYSLNDAVWSKSVSEILREKKALVINNWGTQCSACMVEMPAMQTAYETYKDSIELVAVSNYPSRTGLDSNQVIEDFVAGGGYTFPTMRDANGFTAKFSLTSWPTTVIVDRYGAIARIEVGAITSAEVWGRLIEKYIGEDYVQTFTPGDRESESIVNERPKPDVKLPENHYAQVAAAMNDSNLFPQGASVEWYGEKDPQYAEYMWPFVLGVVPDVSGDTVMYASNTGKENSMAVIYATINVEAGKVFRFDYYAQTEEDDDVLSVIWDGKLIKTISGDSAGWKTCYLYADIVSGEHTLIIAYVKDVSGNVGKDNVYFKNFGFANLNDVGSTDMLRSAAYGKPAENATEYPYYATVSLNETDGYYYVDLSKLENPSLAGNDPKPMLFANLLGATQWSGYSVSTLLGATKPEGGYLIDCTFTIDGETKDYRETFVKYLMAANASYVKDCVPVNEELRKLLTEFIKVANNKDNAKEWLEVCYFYSHYGEGAPIGNPILGVMKESAIPLSLGETTADLTRDMRPFPVVTYAFTPTESAVYKFESLIPALAQKYAQIWLYDEATDLDTALSYCGDGYVTRDGTNEHNFTLYYYLTAGKKYYVSVAFLMSDTGSLKFSTTNVGASKTVFTPCSFDDYTMILNQYGEFTGELLLRGAIEYVKVGDYYHAKNADGTAGDFIYLDLKYATTTLLSRIPLTRLVTKKMQDPKDFSDLDYNFFDFRYRVVFLGKETDEIINYDPKADWTKYGAQYKDYTSVVEGWVATAQNNDGLIKVTQEVVDILKLFIEMRSNSAYLDGTNLKQDAVLENEWLRFCWYNKTYGAPQA